MQKALKIAGGLLTSFGPLVLFVGAEHLLSLRWAIGLTTGYTLAEVVWRKARGQKLDQLFIFTAAMTLGFGSIDLVLNQALFLKYEAVVTNALTGVYFAGTVWKGKSLLQVAYEKRPDAAPLDAELATYFDALTLFWSLYFFAKSVLYVFIARRYDYDHALAIRTVVGNVSLLGLAAISYFFGQQIAAVARRLGLVRAPPPPAP